MEGLIVRTLRILKKLDLQVTFPASYKVCTRAGTKCFEGSKANQTLKGKTILHSFVKRSQHTNKYKRITSEHRFLYCSNHSSLYTLHNQSSCVTPAC